MASPAPQTELLRPRSAAEFIVANAKHVRVSEAKARELAAGESFRRRVSSAVRWHDHPLNPDVADDDAARWLFTVDTLNFSFWVPDGEPKFSCEYRGTEYESYWALCACVNRAIDEGLDLLDPQTMSTITKEQLAHVFRSSSTTAVPLLDERVDVLREAGIVLMRDFGGSVRTLIESCGGSAQKLVDTLARHFSSYRDEHEFEGVRVALYKRAQILVGELWACFEGEALGKFDDIDSLTMFADYRVPQILVHLGLLEYDNELRDALERGDLLQSGCRKEVEIRGGSIHAVEVLAAALRDAGESYNAVSLDFLLLDTAKSSRDELAAVPIHHTRSIFY